MNKKQGVLFRIMVVSGTDIGPYSHIPTEGEVLLSPNTVFTVTRELYVVVVVVVVVVVAVIVVIVVAVVVLVVALRDMVTLGSPRSKEAINGAVFC